MCSRLHFHTLAGGTCVRTCGLQRVCTRLHRMIHPDRNNVTQSLRRKLNRNNGLSYLKGKKGCFRAPTANKSNWAVHWCWVKVMPGQVTKIDKLGRNQYADWNRFSDVSETNYFGHLAIFPTFGNQWVSANLTVCVCGMTHTPAHRGGSSGCSERMLRKLKSGMQVRFQDSPTRDYSELPPKTSRQSNSIWPHTGMSFQPPN
jgi:hypothetical protein|mmetsp:Transcript_44800/g.75367  ORF Transcript_44800/g.75367 Transcript_44800/m.75367 type:complete len:202 (+) Transcript_44800:293-898(+)